jgi:branched-chain amino acid transport system permease protein
LTTYGNLLISGFAAGAVYALLAIGYNLMFASTGTLNFAHGHSLMLGAVLGAVLMTDNRWSLAAALVVVLCVAGAIGALTEVVAVRPATSRGTNGMVWVLSTLGVAIAVEASVGVILGDNIRQVAPVISLRPTVVAGLRFVPDQLLLIAVAILSTLLVAAVGRWTTVGKAMFAMAQDREAAVMRGIPAGIIATVTFAIAAAFAALAGFLLAPQASAYPAIGLTFALKGFIAAALGGIPVVRGALIGGFALGLCESVGVYQVGPAYRNVLIFGVLIAMLTIRPGGLFGTTAVRQV